jgi:hypothetical protein
MNQHIFSSLFRQDIYEIRFFGKTGALCIAVEACTITVYVMEYDKLAMIVIMECMR